MYAIQSLQPLGERVYLMAEADNKIDMAALQQTLKVLYGCTVMVMAHMPRSGFVKRLLGPGRESSRSLYQRERQKCVSQLLQARKRRDDWEVGVHRDHLVAIDGLMHTVCGWTW